MTASSTASLAILIVSNASFMAGSTSGSYGSGGGESSAIRFARSAASSTHLSSSRSMLPLQSMCYDVSSTLNRKNKALFETTNNLFIGEAETEIQTMNSIQQIIFILESAMTINWCLSHRTHTHIYMLAVLNC